MMISMRNQLAQIGLVPEDEVRKLDDADMARGDMRDRLQRRQMEKPKAWRQAILEELLPTKSTREFRRAAIAILLFYPEAIDDVVDAAHILKGEKNGMKLIGQAFQVRDGLSKFDGNQREWFLKNTFGVYRKARRGYLRIVR